ncbi:MAG: nitronate monooxygenase [Candidatus Izemoplasmatales bacterium]|nr:nitronate monooxygenase [Candidatus Izemoplasmatales bacterium]MDD5293789.1 nitronate monooxygenase [Candidatus Izemoplasmatales bacterium]
MNTICQRLNLDYPIIQGGMANIADHRLAAAVANAGGLGVIGSGSWDAETVRNEIRLCRQMTNKPFAVNIVLLNPHAKDIAQVVVEEHVFAVTTGAGNPGQYLPMWKEAGIIVIPVIASTAQAKRLEKAGADMVIAEGTEAGGHIGELTTMCLVPQVVDAVEIPVIAAGGIADARGVRAAFALGAQGVQCGTLFLTSEECPIHSNYKQMIIEAKDIDTIVTGRHAGSPVRVLKNQMARTYVRLSEQGVDRETLEKMTLGSLRKAVIDGDLEHGSFMAGQSAGLIHEIRPVQEIIASLFASIPLDDPRLHAR